MNSVESETATIRSTRHVGAVLAVAAALVVGLAERPREVLAAPAPYPIYVVSPPLGDFAPLTSTRVSPDGRFAAVVQGERAFIVSMPFGTQSIEGLPGDFVPDSGGVFAYRRGNLDTVQLVRLEDRQITEVVMPPTISGDVVDVDAAGRVILTRRGLYDSVSGDTTEFVTFSPAEAPPFGVALSDDGRYYTVRDSDFAAGSFVRTVTIRYDRTGQTPAAIASPVSFEGPYEVSSDLGWLVTLDETGAGSTLLRQNLFTGDVEAVPVDGEDVREFSVDDAGRVVVSHTVPTEANANSLQLSLWDGSGALVLLTRGLDGEPADLGVERSGLGPSGRRLAVSDDGSRVTFTSQSTNLAEAAATVERRLFQIVLPPVQRERVGSRLLPDQSMCVPAIGAAPGEYVGVNVTAVGASVPGYGVLHSSDERASGTSTVNFGPGTVDPNVGFVRVGVDGEVCFTNSSHGPVHVLLDEMVVASAGTFGAYDDFPSLPRRALDTRVDDSPVQPGAQDCRASVLAPFVPGRPIEDVVIGVNTTPVGAVAPGYGTVHTYLMSPGAASTVNFGPGTVDPNFSFVQTFAWDICFTNSQGGPVHVVIDQMVADHEHALRTPPVGADGGRPVDTRVGVGGTRLAASGSVCFAVAGSVAGEFVGVNVTPVGATTFGFGTVHLSGSEPGEVSNVNFGPGTVDPNFAMTRVGVDGRVCFTNSVHGAVDVIIDAQVIGAAEAFRLPSAGGSVRILDTREARP